MAAGLLTITACGAKAVSFEDWKKKADACEDKTYATATLKVVSNSKDADGSEEKENATYHYTLKDGGWANDETEGAKYSYFVGMRAKDAFQADPSSTATGYKYTFYSDLSIKVDIDSTTSLLGYSVVIKGSGSMKFNGNGYLTSYSSKSTTTLTTPDGEEKATSSGTMTISYK